MMDVDRSGDISADDIDKFYANLKKYKVGAVGSSSNVPEFDAESATNLVRGLDVGRGTAITPDQFFNIIMAAYE